MHSSEKAGSRLKIRTLSFALTAIAVLFSICAAAQDESTSLQEGAGDVQPDPATSGETEIIDASTLGGDRTNTRDDSVGVIRDDNPSAGWTTYSSETESSSSSTTLTVGDPVDSDAPYSPPVRDAEYWEATLAGRWFVQGEADSCTVTLTNTRWGSNAYRFRGVAGCPGSLLSGVSWSSDGHKLVVRGPVSPIVTFRERGPNRWDGVDQDGKRISLTR